MSAIPNKEEVEKLLRYTGLGVDEHGVIFKVVNHPNNLGMTPLLALGRAINKIRNS